ncbi:MAG: hypothetical protein J6A04_06965 [Clostridia bacterium]|nr:hypothetical protein [Clostridia bacterium]
MAVVFFIILFFILLLLVVVFSTIKIRMQRVSISNCESKKMKYNYSIIFELRFLNFIRVLKLEINPEKIKKLNQKVNLTQKLQKVDFKKVKKDLPSKEERKELMKKLKIKLEEFHLNLEFGTKDVLITSAIIAILSSALGIMIARLIDHYEEEKYEYKMLPIYKNKNVIKLSLNCIIQIKVVHIISIIYTLVKKRKEKRKNERTSNRRSYDYSYGQY